MPKPNIPQIPEEQNSQTPAQSSPAWNPQPYNTPVPLQNPYEKYQLLKQSGFQTPDGMQKIWTGYSNTNRNVTFWKPDNYARFRPDLPPAVWDNTKPFQGYWDNPRNVVEAYNFLRLQDDDFEPPPYVNKDFVNGLYQTLKAYNGTDDTRQWQPLPFGTEEAYVSYVQPGPDWWETQPGNRFTYTAPKPPATVEEQIGKMQLVVDDVNQTLREALEQGQISQDEYDESVKYFSEYALSDEARATLGGGMTADQLAQPFDPRDMTELMVANILDQQGVLDVQGKPVKSYTEMEPFARALLTIFGAPEEMQVPEASRQTAAAIQGGMTWMGVAGVVGTAAAIAAKATAPIAAGAAATGVGAPAAVAIPIVSALIGGFAGFMQYRAAITGEQNPVSKVTSTVFNWLSEKSEQVLGSMTYASEIQAYTKEMKESGKTDEEVVKAVTEKYGIGPDNYFKLFSETFTAGRMYYESAAGRGAGDYLVDSVSTLAHLVNPEWSSGLTTGPGEVWQIQLGYETPQKLGLDSTDVRAAILKDIKSLGPDPKQEDVEGVLAMWYQAIGFSGNMNDFAGQMMIDPLNFVPAALNKGIDVYATHKFNTAAAAGDIVSAQKFANLSEAARVAIGNPLIDSLPFGVQNGVEWIGSLITKTAKDGLAPKWFRGTLPPAQTFNLANAYDAKGYQPKMFYDVFDNLKKSGQPAPIGSVIDIVPASAPGAAMPLAKMFLSADHTAATFSLFDEAGRYVTTQSVKAPEGTTFKTPVEAVDYFKTVVDSENYKSQFPDDKFRVVLKGATQLTETAKTSLFEYVKSAGEDAPRLVESVSIINPDNGETIASGRINFDTVKEGATTYEVTGSDGRTVYKVDASSDKIVSASADGKDVPIPAEGYLVTAGKDFVLSDSYVNHVDTQLVNSMADALGVERPYEDLRTLKLAEPSYKAKPTVVTGNKLVDGINKLMDITPEGKIAFTNRAITEVIMDVSLLAKNDPDKFFAFFDYIAGKDVEVSQGMKDYAHGSMVATAMVTLKSALADGGQLDTLRKTWQMGTVHRVQATNLARALGITPEKMVSMRPDDIFKRLTAYNTKIAQTDPSKVIDMSAAELKKFMAPYQGADALPLTKQQLVNKAIFAFVSDSEKAAIKLYNPQPGSNLTQFSNMLKSIIGVPFISANPATWMMNAFNNWVTMNIFIGAGGLFETSKAMQSSIDRFGVDYTMLIGNEFKVSEVITHATPELQKILHPDNWMTDVRSFISKLSASETIPLSKLADAAGVRVEDLLVMNPSDVVKAVETQNSKIKNKSQHKYSGLTEATVEKMVAPYIGENAKPLTKTTANPLAFYGKIEQFFARRAMKVAIDQIMGSMELSPIKTDLRSDMINAGMSERQANAFQSVANRAFNMDEIKNFYQKGEIGYNPVPEEIIKTTIDKLSGGDDAQKAVINSLLDFNGLRDDITDLLSKPRTPEELDAARLGVYKKIKEAANHSRVNNLAGEFAKVTEDTAGHIGLLKNLFQVGQEEYRTLFSVNRQFGEFWDAVDNASKSGMTDDAFRAYKANLWSVTSEITRSMWDDTYKTMLNTVTAGMAKTGIGEDADFFVTNLAERLDLMRQVHSDITKINQDAYDGVIKSTEAPKLLDDVYSNYRKMRDANQKAWVDKIIELYDKNGIAPNGKTKEEVHNILVGYMGEFLKKDRKFRNDILDHRRAIEGIDYENKRAANKNFYEQVYQAQAQDILKFLTNDAYEEFNTIRNPKYSSKGAGQTSATKSKAKTQAELDVANKRAILDRNETALEHRRMLQEQAKATYGQYNKMSFEGELSSAAGLTDAQKVAASAYFEAFDATAKRLSEGKFGFYDRLGEIGRDIAQEHIAALTAGADNKFILNFATDATNAAGVFREGSNAIMYTARQLYDMGVFDGYKTIIEDAGKTTIAAFDAMDDAGKSKVMDDIADSMFKWQADPEVAKTMPANLYSAFQTISTFFTDFIGRLMERYKGIEISPALKEVYRSLFVQNDAAAKAERDAARTSLIESETKPQDLEGVPEVVITDSDLVETAINNLDLASKVEGNATEKHNAIATPLKEAIKLLNDMKARNGDAEAIAKLEAAIIAAPEKLLSDADINSVSMAPAEITAEMKRVLFDMGYTEENVSAMTPSEAWRIIGEGQRYIPPQQGELFQPEELTYQPAQRPLPPITPDPPQGPLSIDQARALDQLNDNEIMNLVGEITDNLEKYMRENPAFEIDKNIPPQALEALQKQTAIWESELDSKKMTAMDYAKSSRDHALLDYTQRRGIDGLYQQIWPYHFWYTSSVVEWAKHLVGDPAVASGWSKFEELRRRNGMVGFPSRMAGKVWIPAPWLPDYLGNEIFADPFSRLMPLESIAQPVSLFSDLSADIYSRTVYQINMMVRDGILTPDQGAAAIQMGSGEYWEDALAEVMLQDDLMTNDAVSLASQMMGIAPWWQYPYYFATGQEDKISVMPPTRLGQAISSFRGQGWAWDMFSYVGEVLKYPEEKVRETLDMSPYGEPGDYYIRLMLTSMLGDGTTSNVDEVEKQMIERKGDLWEEAKRRADVYLSARLPGSLFLHTVAQFTNNPTPENAKGIAPSFMLTLFPAGMIPEGEQHMRDISVEYQKAWRDYNMGKTDALNEFYDKYPEYRARQDMFKDDETMLKGFLVDQIWDKWSSIPAASRQLATQSLGETFQRLFLDAKAYTNIDNNTLAAWSYQLGGYVPVTEETAGAAGATQLPVPRYNPEVEAAVAQFQAERAQRYPDYYWQQQIYWDPASDKEELKRTMPSYFDYLDWRKQYYKDNPLVAQWAEDQSARGGTGDDSLLAPTSDIMGQTQPTQSLLIEFDDTLKAELGKYIVNGTPLSAGAKSELNRIWVAKGRPGSSLEQWINAILGLH